MHPGLVVPLITIAAIIAFCGPMTGTAKTFISISPESGPPGTTVEVGGEGFADGQVRIELSLPGALPQATQGGLFLDDESRLPVTHPLTTATSRQGLFVAQITLPSGEEIKQLLGADVQQVDILGIQRTPTDLFVTGTAFTLTPASLPSTGTGVFFSFSPVSELLIIGIGLMGLALLGNGWRTRRIFRT